MTMFKTILNMLIGALVAASVGAAVAVQGIAPSNGFGAWDGTWLLGLSGGTNYAYQSGITAHAGGGQASCVSLTPGIYLYEVDTVASANDSVCLPFAQQGTNFSIRNGAASNALAIYAQANNNLLTAAADTINGTAGSTEYPSGGLSAGSSVECFAAKNGVWSCVHGN
jgi:hypothetical protein